MKKITAALLAVLMLLGMFPVTAFALGDDEYVEPIYYNWMYTLDTYGSQAQGGELPNGFMLDGEYPEAELVIPPRRASGLRFLRWDGTPDIAVMGEDGFTRFTVRYSDFTPGENGGYTTPYSLGSTYYSSVFETGVTVTFNAQGGKLNGMDKWIEEIAEEKGVWNINLAAFVPQRDGYSFLGWGIGSSSADKTVLDATDYQSSDAALRSMEPRSINGGTDYCLYAKWQNAEGDDFTYDEKTKTLTIFTDQGYNDFREELSEELLSSVEHLVMLEGVTALQRLSGFSFSKMFSLKSIVISPSVKEIYRRYFMNMPSLEEVAIPASVTRIYSEAFAYCEKLKTVEFTDTEVDPITPRETLSIESYAFSGCAISEVRFPKQLQKLYNCVFEGCPLKDVYFQKANFRESQYIYICDTGSGADGSFDLAGTEVVLHFPETIAEMYKTEVIPNYAEIINPREGFRRYPVSVNGETFNTDKLQIPCGDGYAAFDPHNNILTLHNAEISETNMSSIGYTQFACVYAGINADCESLTVVLEGENSLTGDFTDVYYDDELGQWVEGSQGALGVEALGALTITGSGSLTFDELANDGSRVVYSKTLTIEGTAVYLPKTNLTVSGKMLVRDSSFEFNDANADPASGETLTFENSTVRMTGRLSMGYSDADLVFDGGDFTATSDYYLLSCLSGHCIYRGGVGIVSGGWEGGKGGIHIASMDVTTDEATGVKLGNTGRASVTVTSLVANELSECQELLGKTFLYGNYAAFSGFDIALDPETEAPLTVFVPAPENAVPFCVKSSNQADTLVSYSEDGYCRFTVYGGGRFFLAIPFDTTEYYRITISRVLPETAKPTVTLVNGDDETAFDLNSDGSYLAEAENSNEAIVSVSAQGYRTMTFKRAKGTAGNWNIGEVVLEPIPSSGVIFTSIKSSDYRFFSGFDGLNPVLSDGKRALTENTDYTLSYPYIILSESYVKVASAKDRLILTLTPDSSLGLAPGSAETTLEALFLGVTLSAWGGAEIAVQSDFVSFNHILIFDSEGTLVESGTAYGGKTYATSPLPEGSYTAVGINSNPYFPVFASLDDPVLAEIVEGEDYACAAFKIENGKTAKLGLDIPTLTVSSDEGGVDHSRCSMSLYPSEISVNTVFRAKLAYALKKAEGTLVISLPRDSEVYYVSKGNTAYVLDQVYDADSHKVTIPADDSEGEVFIGMSVSKAGMRSISAALDSGGRLTPIAGNSFNPTAAVRVSAPANTDKSGFTAILRGTADSRLSVELNGDPYATVTTNAVGTARVKINVPDNMMTGSNLVLRVYDESGSYETTTYYEKENATALDSLSADYSVGTVYFVSKGTLVKKPNYSCPNSKQTDWWTITAKLSGPVGALDTENVSAQIMLENGDFRTVDMNQTGSVVTDGEQSYTFKGMYKQNGYVNVSKPVNISLFFRDKSNVFVADTSCRLDYDALSGATELHEKLDALDAETEQAVASVTNQSTAELLIESFRQSDSYKKLTAEQKAAYDAAAERFQAPAEAPLPDNPLFNNDFKISGTEQFKTYSEEEQTQILGIEDSMQDCIEVFSMFMKLKKPINAYDDVSEIYAEMGYTITENYTDIPDDDYTQMDQYVWYRYDSEKKITSVIDTEKKVRADVDYDKMERRREEIAAGLRELFGVSGKGGAAVGDGDGGDVSVETVYDYFKDRVDNQEDIEVDDFVADSANSVYEYFASDILEMVKNHADKELETYIKTQAINYEKAAAAELAAGGDGFTALEESRRCVDYITKHKKLSSYIEKTGKGLEYAGDALTAWEIYKHNSDINEYDEAIEQYRKAQDAIWNSKLPYEDKMTILRDGEEYIQAVMELQAISRHDLHSNVGQAVISVTNKIFENPILNVGLDIVGMTVPAFDDYKNSLKKAGFEEIMQLKERRLLQLLEKAKSLENEEKKLDEQNIPYNDSVDVDFGIDIPPEVAEWYYEARLEEAKKRGIDVQPIMDPSGVVYEAVEDNLLEGVTATIWYSPCEDGVKAQIWDAEEYDQINPQITGKNSGYAWDVPEGYWQVRFEKDGYEAAQTDWLPVPPPQLNIKTAMISTEKPQVETAVAYSDYIELHFSQYMDVSYLPTAESYSAEWTDTKLSPDGKTLSKTLVLSFKNSAPAAGETVGITLDGAVNYAGKALDTYEAELTVIERPSSISVTPEGEVQTYFGGSTIVSVQVIGADGTPMSGVTVNAVAEDGTSAVLIAQSAVTDENRNAEFTVNGADIGCTTLVFTVDGTAVSASVKVITVAERSDIEPPVLIGDADGNGRINICDVTAIQRHLADIDLLTGSTLKAADVDGNGTVTIEDATLLQQYLAEMIESLG